MKCVVIFSSIHQVMRAEKFLKGKGIKIDLIPVPREISSDCGVAIELPLEVRENVLHLFEENKIRILECYTKAEGNEFEKIE
jgi:hypothetical protein